MIYSWERDHTFGPSPAMGFISKVQGPRQSEKGTGTSMFALKRLRRKLEVLKEDFKRSGSNNKYDIEECLALIDIVEKEQNAWSRDEAAHKADLGDVSRGQVGTGDSY